MHSTIYSNEKVCVWAQLLSRVWLFCDPIDFSLPGFSVHGIFSSKNTVVGCHYPSPPRGYSHPRDQTLVSCVSCIGRWILCCWVTWETQWKNISLEVGLCGVLTQWRIHSCVLGVLRPPKLYMEFYGWVQMHIFLERHFVAFCILF